MFLYFTEMHHLLVLFMLLGSVTSDGNFSFVDTEVIVSETRLNQAEFNIRRTGGSSGQIVLTCTVLNSSAATDLDGSTQNAIFLDGETSSSCTFTVKDDDTPEINETFTVELDFAPGMSGALIVSPSIAHLTILANDNAFGTIGFNESGPIVMGELSELRNTRSISVVRKAGLFGRVEVPWQITSGPNSGADDFLQTSGNVVFEDGQNTANLSLKVKPDNVPESDESFTVMFQLPTGGARLDVNAKEITVQIPANDAPVWFPLEQYSVPENQSTVEIEVYRGLQQDGVSTIGPVDELTTVDWYLQPGSAVPGSDYVDGRGTLRFDAGLTKKKIIVTLMNDNLPEQNETFTVHLVNASQNAYVTPPGIATVSLQPSDDHNGVISFSQHPSILDEDGAYSGTFNVNRSAGTFGTVTVSWEITGPDASSVFAQTSGQVSFPPGSSLSSFQVIVTQDSLPEETKEFHVQLGNATGGARLANSPQSQRAVLYVRDSDDVYGVIQFARLEEQKLIMDSNPRELRLNITRTGGTIGVLAVNLSVVYLLPGSNSPSNELQLSYPRIVTIAAGDTSVLVTVTVANSGIIKQGSAFKVDALAPRLQSGGTPLTNTVAASSPRLGDRASLYINVTAKDANGDVGFSTADQKVTVQEPFGPSSQFVYLTVKRSGTVNRVVVHWNITSSSPTFFPNDSWPASGDVVFEQGHDEVNITIEIKPDDTPEVAEFFTVNLVNASNLDRIQPGANTVEVTIEESDNPGGTFELKDTSSVVLEEGSGFFFHIVRQGSALDTRWVSFSTEPPAATPAEVDFSGNTKDVKFLAGEREKQFYIACTNDNIPEVDERFVLKLSNDGFGNQKGTLGSKTTINITVLKNDDPYGVFGFTAPNIVKVIDESKDQTHRARFEVNRDRGTFGKAVVYWNISSLSSGGDAGDDVTPVSGQVSFADGQSLQFITVQSLPDKIPEGNESFTVHLVNVSNDARLASQQLREAVLVIVKNDDPVYFAAPTLVQVTEGQYGNLTIERGGDGQSTISVFYTTMDGTATSASGDYQPKTERVTFEVGVFRKDISIWVMDDSTPEGVETFAVKLINATGDTVLYGNINATVSIYASDGGTGIFQFAANSLNKTTTEGSTVEFSVERAPRFGQVRVYWEIMHRWPNGSVSELLPGQEFSVVADFVTFFDGDPSQVISVTPRSDGIAELDEQFELRMLNATGIQTGEDGQIGAQSTALLTVTANDYPNGLFKFANRSVDIAEDFNPGMESTTIKNLVVLRDQGTWGTVKVAWEIETASESSIRSDNAYDLFLLGSKMAGVTSVPSQRRQNTGTYVYCFDGTNNESFVEAPGVPELEAQFSVRLWVNASTGTMGYVLASVAGDAVNFALSLNTTGHTTLSNFSYLSGSTEIDFGKDIADGSWHLVVITVTATNPEARFYIDGDSVGSPWSLPSGSFTSGAVYRVGKRLIGEPQFTGCLQDVTLYPDVLVADLIKVMAQPNNELKPINGYLTFEPDVRQRVITISTIDDSKPEAKTPYTVVLYSPLGGASLDTAGSDFKMLLQVLKSDNANGLFGFQSISPVVVSESTNVTVTIDRSKGAFGTATVMWAVYKGSSSMEASEDFLMSSGSVVFAENENEKALDVPVNDDLLPEENEHFTLKLTSVLPSGGTTPTSAASLQPGFTEVNITIQQSDYPYGLLQFMSSVPDVNDSVLPATTPFRIDIRESINTLTLDVIRAQGTLGQVRCQWKTVAGTAKSPDDFTGSTGAVEFADGARNSTIQIAIADDNIAELNKSFEVQLFNPDGGAELNPVAKTAYVTILPSDDAFGVIRFAPDSLRLTVREGIGGTVFLIVQRSKGVLGPVTVYWQADGVGASDLESTNGSATLQTGSNTTQIELRVTDDQSPELSESFLVRLTSVSAGRLDSSGIQSNVTILPSDDPYGVFVFSPSSLTITESNVTVNLTIKRLSGTRSTVRVNYSSVDSGHVLNVRLASPHGDYEPVIGSVMFIEGQTNVTVTTKMLDDNIPEAAETVIVNLTSVELVGGHPVLPAPENSPRLGSSRAAFVVIEKNDNANGIVQLSASAVRVHEPNVGVVVNVTRTEGAFGAVNVLFDVLPATANSSDYRIISRNITLQENQRIAAIPVQIIHDMQPELEEIFTIKLTGVQGGAVLGSTVECTVTILENDYPYGFIGFDNASLRKSVHERDSLSRETLRVIRRFGLKGGSRVDWEARYKGALAVDDVSPTQGFLVFAEGEREKFIQFDVKPDAVPEIAEVIEFNLTKVTFRSEGLPSLDEATRVARVQIEANDKPHGVVEFNQSTYNVTEGNTAYLSVSRLFGISGDIQVFYSTVEHVGGVQATPNVDYNGTTNSSITIPDGQNYGTIAVPILDDLDPELAETFDVVLEYVELVGQPSVVPPPELGAVKRITVTIVMSDDAHGLMVITAKNADPGSGGSRVTVEEKQSFVNLVITRLKGSIGRVTVTTRVLPQRATAGNDFIGSNSTYTFQDGDNTSEDVVLIINDDDLPERDEIIIVQLVDPTGGVSVEDGVGNNVTVIIEANDGVAGEIGFDDQSRAVVIQEGLEVILNLTRNHSAGRVSVDWLVEGVNASMDFASVNGTVVFDEGETRTSIILGVSNDTIPEIHEVFVVRLSNVTTMGIASSGQASLAQDRSSATVSIRASDRPHGVVELQLSSRMVLRGDELNFTLTVSRLFGNIGAVRVYYESITGNMTALGPNQELASAGEDFIPGKRSIEIGDGISVGLIPVWIVEDSAPELDEVFLVNLTGVELVNPDQFNDTIPPLLGSQHTSQITLESNDNPNGVFKFPEERVYLNESSSPYNLTVLRDQGTFGVVEVNYFVLPGTASLADFSIPDWNQLGERTLTFAEGQREHNITIYVTDDTEPEGDETLTIILTKNTGGAGLGNPNRLEVVINANDDAYGVFNLSSSSLRKTISEPGTGPVTEAEFVVERSVHSYGSVDVYWEVVNASASTDLTPASGRFTFDDGVTRKSFTVMAVLDQTPERAETFVIRLSIPGNGRLTTPYEALLTITENESPYGDLGIVSSVSLTSSVDVEENQAIVKAKVLRSQGDFGRITVDYMTLPQSASSASGDVVHFEKMQQLRTAGAYSWHTFSAYQDQFLLLASNNRTGPLPSGVDDVAMGDYFGSALFRWQGVLVPLQTIATDGGVAWDSVTVGDKVYLAVANHGSQGQYEAVSRIYSMNSDGELAVVQNLSTQGAVNVKFFLPPSQSDLYLIVANQMNNAGETHIDSQVYKWEVDKFVVKNVGIDKTRSASGLAVFEIGGSLKVTISFYYDSVSSSFSTKSPVYEWRSGSFILLQEINTNGPVDVEYFQHSGQHYLVFANSKSSVEVFRWNGSKFVSEQTLSTVNVLSAKPYIQDGNAYLAILEDTGMLMIYMWTSQFVLHMNTTIPNSLEVTPVVINDAVAGNVSLFATAVSGMAHSPLLRPVNLSSQADFIPRRGQLTFENGQRELELDFTIFPDTIPERDETFIVRVFNATGKASVNPQKKDLTINILSNDDAHGRIGFAFNSLKRVFYEPVSDSVVNFEVIREHGSIGRVVAEWNISGNVSGIDVSPLSGEVVFEDGETSNNISITVRRDAIPELSEVAYIRLLRLTETGSSNPNRSAVLNTARITAMLIIPANDDPYGVVRWKDALIISQEDGPKNATRTVTILRQFGLIGDIVISYETVKPSSVINVDDRAAQPGVDYRPIKSTVEIPQDVNSTQITLDITHTNSTEIKKIFYVNITGVALKQGSATAASPRIDVNSRVLEVVIAQPNQTAGELNFNTSGLLDPQTQAITIGEEAGIIILTVRRSGSSVGVVGFRFIVRPVSSVLVAPTTSSDFSPSEGTVMFPAGDSLAVFNVSIANDVEPEVEEGFFVQISRPLGGVRIGPDSRVDIVIMPSDYPYGLFGFKTAYQQSNPVAEGSSLHLEVQRLHGTFRDVHVYWTVTPDPGIANASFQLTPINGTLTFKQGVTFQFISLHAVDDSVPEAEQKFSCELVSVDNDASLNSASVRAVVFIPDNDNAEGVVSVDPSTRNIVTGEPIPGYDGVFTIRLLRSVGQFGEATVTWQITSQSSDPSSTFNVTSGTVIFQDGVDTVSLFIKVTDDAIAEELAVFTFSLTTAIKTSLDPSEVARRATITVVASDDPFGILEFQSPLTRNVSEDVGFANVTVVRSGGNSGQLSVNYSVTSITATKGVDYESFGSVLFFADKEDTKAIPVLIKKDDTPELAETITVKLLDVKLISSSPLNYSEVDGLQLNIPPNINRNKSELHIVIQENDDARGIIQFAQSTKLVREEAGNVDLEVRREGGSLGEVVVSFTVNNGTAYLGEDFALSSGTIRFTNGQNSSVIAVPIINDDVPEHRDFFFVTLDSVTGGAKLGSVKTVTVTIETSDDPAGLFGFVNSTTLSLDNPNITTPITFVVSRQGGAEGQIEVLWRLHRSQHSCPSCPLADDFSGQTSGSLLFPDGFNGIRSLQLFVEPYRADEPEETFSLIIYNVTGNGSIDGLQSSISITILKRGFPNGVFGFTNTATRTYDEPGTGQTRNIQFAVERTKGTQGTVNVNWEVSSPSGSPGSRDLSQTSGTLTFNPGDDVGKNIVIGLKGDDIPELEAVYVLMITSVDGGGDIDTSASNVTFKISPNDDPHGTFRLLEGAQRLRVNGDMSRELQLTVRRDKGTFGAVEVFYEVRYSDWYPGQIEGSVTVPDSQAEVPKSIMLSSLAFLKLGSSFTIKLTRVSFVGSGVTSLPPALASSSTSEIVMVPETAANALFKFAHDSLELGVENDNAVPSITVIRDGMFGNAVVTVAAGFPAGAFPGFTPGEVEISAQSLLFSGSTRNKTFSVKVHPMLIPDKKLVYAVYLDSATTSSSIPGGANITSGANRTAVFERSGVVVIAPDSQHLFAEEGAKVKCKVLRLYSVLDSVRISYVAFATKSASFIMGQGEFSKEFEVQLDSNNEPEMDRVQYINLTQVSEGHSPRLGPNTTAVVTINDDDDPHGVLSFRATRVSVPENATSGPTRTVELEVQRTRGTLGVVSVLVRTVGGGEPWSPSLQSLKDAIDGKSGDKNATVGVDYNQLSKRVTFSNQNPPFSPEGQVQKVQLEILDDLDPEPEELVLLYLSDATGEARIATDSDSSLQSWATVVIEGNDLMSGVFGFVPGSQEATVDEDVEARATLRVGRTKATFGTVQVLWRVRDVDIRDELVTFEGTITFGSGVQEQDLTIRMRDDDKPERATSFTVDLVEIVGDSQARIDSQYRSAVIRVLDSDFPNGTIRFSEDAIYKAVDKSATEVQVHVIREHGTDTDITVHFQTRDLTEAFTSRPGVKTYQALAGQDYSTPPAVPITFAAKETSKFITITLTPMDASATKYPKAFEMLLLNASSGARVRGKYNTSMVIISDNKETTEFLKLRALAIQTPLSDDAIDKILSDLEANVKNTLDEDQLELTSGTIEVILNDKKNRSTLKERQLQDTSKQLLMNIFDELLNPDRDDTRGQDQLSKTFELFSFSLLYGLPCDDDGQEASIQGKYATAEGFRRTPAQLNGLKINSGRGNDYFQYPSNFYSVDSSGASNTGDQCRDVHFIDYQTSHWFDKPGERAVLKSKVISTSPSDSSTQISSANPVTYRVYANNGRITPKGAECVYWDHSQSSWSNEGCTKKNDKEDFVECQCDHLSNFAAQGESDDRTGYNLPFFIVCFVCLGVFAVAIFIHYACSLENMFAAKLLMHFFFAGLMTQLMFLLGAYLSPELVTEPIRCSVLAMFIHYFFLCQFSWMFVQAWNLWYIFVRNDEHSDRKSVMFIVSGWGFPVAIIALYIIIANPVLGWDYTEAYADVHNNGDMCFVPNAYAAIANTLGPVLLFLLAVAVVFTQAYQVSPQWVYYDDIFRGHYNIREFFWYIGLFVLMTVVWLFGGLHLALGDEGFLIAFVVLDALLALYVFVWYCCLRNQCRGVFKRSFAVPGMVPPVYLHDDMFRDRPSSPGPSIASLKRQERRSSPEDPSDWEDMDLGATPKGSRKMLFEQDDTDSLGRVNNAYDDDYETRDFDDLIFALKTGGQFEPALDDEKDMGDHVDLGEEHYEMRRISIADTHL